MSVSLFSSNPSLESLVAHSRLLWPMSAEGPGRFCAFAFEGSSYGRPGGRGQKRSLTFTFSFSLPPLFWPSKEVALVECVCLSQSVEEGSHLRFVHSIRSS